MKKIALILLAFISLQIISLSCRKEQDDDETNVNRSYRQDMRDFVIGISKYTKAINSKFIIIPQNGQELITDNGEGNGKAELDYLSAIDATGRESMF